MTKPAARNGSRHEGHGLNEEADERRQHADLKAGRQGTGRRDATAEEPNLKGKSIYASLSGQTEGRKEDC
jgi:hypothetical protein